MKIIPGSLCSFSPFRATVVGKLYFLRNELSSKVRDGAAILVGSYGELYSPSDGARPSIPWREAVGIVVLCDRHELSLLSSPYSLYSLSSLSSFDSLTSPDSPCSYPVSDLPVLAVAKEREAILRSFEGNVSFLDVFGESLIICPDLRTLDRYRADLSAAKNQYSSDDPSIGGKRTRLSFPTPELSCPHPFCLSGASGCAVDLFSVFTSPASASEEEFFIYLRDAAERLPTRRLTVRLEAPSGEEGEKLFTSALRGILRAAVYGELSVVIRGIRYPSQGKDCLDSISGIFGDLESEGREVNGYIPKGIELTPSLAVFLGVAHGSSRYGNAEHPSHLFLEQLHGFDMLYAELSGFFPALTDLASKGGLGPRPTSEEASAILSYLLSLARPFSELRLSVSSPAEAKLLILLLKSLDKNDTSKKAFLEKLTEVYAPPEAQKVFFSREDQ